MGKVIAVMTHKGGTLKTSITVNLAGVFSQEKTNTRAFSKKKRILIIDTDGQGNAGMSFGFKPNLDFENNIYDVLIEGQDIRKTIVSATKNIDIIGANNDMISFELTALLDRQIPRENLFYLLKKAIEEIKDDYDYILIDTPPNLGLIAGNVFVATDYLLIPFHPEAYSAQSLVTIIEQANKFKERLNPNLSILGVIATKVDNRTNLHADMLQEGRRFSDQLGISFFDTVIPNTIRFANAVAYDKLPATLVDKKHPLVRSYFDLAKEIHKRERELQNV